MYFHHTMLIRTPQLRGEHASLADRLIKLWDQGAFNSPKGLNELEKLWDEDYKEVCAAKGKEIVPATFTGLIPYLSEAIRCMVRRQSVDNCRNEEGAADADSSPKKHWLNPHRMVKCIAVRRGFAREEPPNASPCFGGCRVLADLFRLSWKGGCNAMNLRGLFR